MKRKARREPPLNFSYYTMEFFFFKAVRSSTAAFCTGKREFLYVIDRHFYGMLQ
jgi:hypothetical protein